MFIVPGVEETLRVRGRATISVAPALIERFRLEGERPASVVVVAIEAVWVQNFRAVRRAGLWRAGLARRSGIGAGRPGALGPPGSSEHLDVASLRPRSVIRPAIRDPARDS